MIKAMRDVLKGVDDPVLTTGVDRSLRTFALSGERNYPTMTDKAVGNSANAVLAAAGRTGAVSSM
jgi:hypothetical protein